MNLHDHRKYRAMSVSEADSLFLKIARLKAKTDRAEAALKQKIADLTAAHKTKIEHDLAAREVLEKELAAYILANPGRFVKPRKHPVGVIGTYGIVTDPAYVTISDRDAVIEFAMENGYDDIVRIVRTPDKDALLHHILSGEKIPGAAVVPAGDVAKLSFKKGYAEALEADK